jgi:hypothetical protein
MELNPELSRFVSNWLAKADAIQLKSLEDYFDKFFTLYVVYNRLYAEVTFDLDRRRQINISNKKSFPDREAATNYVLKVVGSTKLITSVTGDSDCAQALREIEQLIEGGKFSIKLNIITGCRQPDEDQNLLSRLRSSTNKSARAQAILDLVYSVRCNTFHGHKGFDEIQIQILGPVIVLLKKIIELTKEALTNNQSECSVR